MSIAPDYEPRTYRGSDLDELLPKIREELGADANRRRDRAIGLLASLAALGALDQARAHEHLHVEVQVAGVDVEPLRELTIRQRLLAFAAQRLQHAKSQRMA